jgi:hypothetical protein
VTPSCMHCNQPLEAHSPQPSGDSRCPDGRNTFNFEFSISPEVAEFVKANIDKPADELARLWIERVIAKDRERVKRGDVLVRVFTPDRDHPYEGLIICRDHLRQILSGDDPPFILEEIDAARATFWNHRCLMCGVDPVPDRVCQNDRCGRALHPQWPAVYCKNLCATEDA